MDFYFTDRHFNLLGIASTGLGRIQVVDDTDYELAPDSVGRTYTATLVYGYDDIAKVQQMAALGNYVLYKDERGKSVFMTIMEYPDNGFDPQNGELTFIANDGGLSLINSLVGAYTATKALPIEDYINQFTAGSGFKIGTNELGGNSRKLSWDGTDTALARIESVATQFDGEIDFSFEISGTSLVNRYIDIYRHIGADKQQRLEVNTHLNNITTSGNIYNLYTSVYATGATPEGKDAPITLKGYKWTDSTGRYQLTADGYLRDTVANATWSEVAGNYINREISYEAQSQAELLQSALGGLKKAVNAEINYSVDIAELPDNMQVGDTIHAVDELQNLNLSARLLELKTSYADGTRTATLGDYLIEEDQTSTTLQALATQLKNAANKPVYTWIAYADTADGQGISLFPNGKAYIGIAVNMADKETDISDPSRFNWQLTKGEPGQPGKDGTNGVPGAKGADGRTSYFHTAWADSENGSVGFTTSGGDGKKYVGTYSDFTQADSTEPSSYNWALFKGVDGKDGYTPIKGTDYFDGKDGQDGKSSYLWIKYSANANGTDMTSDPTGAKYVGYATTQTATEPTSASAYKWQLVVGKDGIPGEKGTDGKTSYLHIRYSNDGGKTFTANSGEVAGTYIGQYTDFTQSDSNSVSDYKWALIKGEKGDTGSDGKPGKDGIGLATTTVTYQESTSGTTIPSGVWTASVPNTSKGKYLWTRTVWTYTDNTSETGYSVSYIAKDGNDGSNGIAGKDGVGIKSTTITYANSTSGTTAPTSGWTANPPATSAGQFIWTKTVWSYTDGTNETGYSVGKIGEKGEKGDTGVDGRPGKDGVGIKSTAITYALGDSGTTEPTTGWTTSVPSLIKGKYLWTKTVWLYTDNTSESGYSATYIGKDGNNGSDGLAGKDGVGISATKVEYAGSTSGTTKPTSGWTSTVPSVAAGNFLWTRTTWSYTDGTSESGYSVAKMGEKGDQGIKGPAGADGKSSYTHIAYATSSTGSGFTQTPTATTTHVGMYVDQTATDSTDPSKYKWTLIKGADGSQGTPGKAGVDGKTPYLHTAYSWSADGTDRFMSVYPGENLLTNTSDFSSNWGAWPGQLSISKTTEYNGYPSMVFTSSSSLNLALQKEVGIEKSLQYTSSFWAKADNVGDKAHTELYGSIGATDFALTTNWVHYSAVLTSTSNAVYYVGIPGGNKGNVYIALPKLEKGSVATSYTSSPLDDPDGAYPKFIGTYTDYTADDSTDPSKYTWAKMRGEQGQKGDSGADGKPGKDGVGIKSTVIQYASNTSGTVAPTTGWATTIPAASPGHYVWTKYTWTYTDGTTEVGYSVGKIGDTGPQGLKGDPGSKDVPVITSGTSFPSTRKTGDMHWMTNSAGTVIGYYKFDGSQWVVQKIDAQSLNVSSLSALSANLGTVTAGTINGVDINGSKFKTTYKDITKASDKGVPYKVSGDIVVGDGSITNTWYYTGRDDILRGVNTWAEDGIYGRAYGENDKEVSSYYLNAGYGLVQYDDNDFFIQIMPNRIVMNSPSHGGILTAENLSQLNNIGKLLWSGAWYMLASQTAVPSLPLSKCLHGWLLVWEGFGNGAVTESVLRTTPIWKDEVLAHPGAGITLLLGRYTSGTTISKYVYPTNTQIKGNDINNAGNTAEAVLVAIHAF